MPRWRSRSDENGIDVYFDVWKSSAISLWSSLPPGLPKRAARVSRATWIFFFLFRSGPNCIPYTRSPIEIVPSLRALKIEINGARRREKRMALYYFPETYRPRNYKCTFETQNLALLGFVSECFRRCIEKKKCGAECRIQIIIATRRTEPRIFCSIRQNDNENGMNESPFFRAAFCSFPGFFSELRVTTPLFVLSSTNFTTWLLKRASAARISNDPLAVGCFFCLEYRARCAVITQMAGSFLFQTTRSLSLSLSFARRSSQEDAWAATFQMEIAVPVFFVCHASCLAAPREYGCVS